MTILHTIVLSKDRRPTAVAVGISVGILGSALALLLVQAGPVITFGLVIAALLGLYLLTSLEAALYAVLAVGILLPFGTLPFSIGFTPSLIETAIGGFLVVYLFQWMTGRRRRFQVTPASWALILFLGVIVFSFLLGLQNGFPTPNLLKNVVGLMLCISLALLLVDVIDSPAMLRRLVAVILISAGTAAAIGIVLWFLNDALAESLLVRLARIGYPGGGVLQYREDGVQVLNERAIGTWIAPNTFGGFLMMVGALASTQVFAAKPVLRWRWLGAGVFILIAVALFLSDSRGSFLGLASALGVIAILKYRQLIPVFIVVGIIALFLPPTQQFIDRLIAGFTASDLETQMRLGEYQDALRLIGRYPVFGVGFSGVPEIDLYIGFSSTYLTLGAYAGFLGVFTYLLAMGTVILWGLRSWGESSLADIWLGLLGGLIAVLVGGIFDHFYFNPEFQPTALIVWSFVGLFLATSQFIREEREPHGTGQLLVSE